MAMMKDTKCGLFGWRPDFLQFFNKPLSFVVLYSLTTFMFTVTLGMNNFLIPAFQNLFNLTSKQIGLILISNDISGLILAYSIGHFGSKSKIRWIGCGVVLSILACAMESGTQLFVEVPVPEVVNETVEGGAMCLDRVDPADTPLSSVRNFAAKNNVFWWILFFGGIIQGVGNTPLQICGMTYIDEILPERRLGPAVGFTQLLQLLGFSISFIFGAYIMKFYVTLGPAPPGVTPGSAYWVGAWWLGYFVPGILMCLTGLPLLLFPSQSPAALRVLAKKIEKGQTSQEEKETELRRSFREQVKDMMPTLRRLFWNFGLVFVIAAECLNNIFHSSMPFDTKIFSLIYRMSVPETGMLLGIFRVLATVIGLIGGGHLASRLNLAGRRGVMYVVAVQLLTLVFNLLPLIHCTPDITVGLDVPYSSMDPLRNLTAECNGGCECSTNFYEPVCDLEANVTFFSACHAGCHTKTTPENGTVAMYSDCTCSNGVTLREGPCPMEASCPKKKWAVLVLGQLIGIMVYISGFPVLQIVYLRIVPELDRSAAQGVRQFFTRTFGFLLGPLIFGSIIDSYCTVWRNGNPSGSCLLYDLDSMIRTIVASQMVLRVAAILCYGIAWKVYNRSTATASYAAVDQKIETDR